MSLIKYPYTNLHEINLDWIIEEVKKCYSPDNPPDMAVISVNGMTGAVTLYTDPAVNFPEVEENSWTIGRTAGGATVGIKFNKTLPLQRVNGTSLFNIYDAGNPPPYPVTSVNGETGDITIQVAFNSLTGDTISFITPSPAHSWSIDRETLDGAISLKLDTTNDTPSAYLEYVSSDETISRTIKLLTPDDIPSSSGVVSVNGEAGVVSLTGDDIPKEDNSSVSVASAINGLEDDTENLNNKIGNTAMGTTATTVTGAVKEHSTAISNVNTKIGTVGNTSLQDQITGINGKIGTVGNTSLQDQITGINGKIGSVGNTSLQDQVNTLNSQITNVTTGQITVNSSKVTSGTLDITSCRKTGKIVNVSARVYNISDGTVSATGVFFNIPEGFRPVATTYGYAYLTIDGGFVPVFAQIGTNGEVQINYSGSKYVTQSFFCATYVI